MYMDEPQPKISRSNCYIYILTCETKDMKKQSLMLLKKQKKFQGTKNIKLLPKLCPLIDKVKIGIYVNIITMSVYIMDLYMD